MDKKHLIFVPKNEKGIHDYEMGIDNNDDYFVFDLPEEEFDLLWKNKVFDILNEKYDLMIDEAEEETVTARQLKDTYDYITPKKGVWMDAVNRAIEFGTCAYLHF